jgi:hypothetical protein
LTVHVILAAAGNPRAVKRFFTPTFMAEGPETRAADRTV